MRMAGARQRGILAALSAAALLENPSNKGVTIHDATLRHNVLSFLFIRTLVLLYRAERNVA